MRYLVLLLIGVAVGLAPVTLLATVRGADTYVIAAQPAPTCKSSFSWAI